MTNKQYLLDCAKTYREDLINNIMPFWLKNGLDTVNGGVYTCVDRDGSIIDLHLCGSRWQYYRHN